MEQTIRKIFKGRNGEGLVVIVVVAVVTLDILTCHRRNNGGFVPFRLRQRDSESE